MQVIPLEKTRFEVAMNAVDVLDSQLSAMMYGLKKAVQEEAKALKGRNVVITKSTGYLSVRFFLKGAFGSERSVVVSGLVEKGEVVSVVYEDLNKGVGKDTITRHYQPAPKPGDNVVVEPGKPLTALEAQQGYSWPVQMRIEEGPLGVTRCDLEDLHLDMFYYLKEGKLPNLKYRKK